LAPQQQDRSGLQTDALPPADIQAALHEMFGGSKCHIASEVEVDLRTRLISLGHAEWTVTRRAGVDDGDCVSDLAIASERTIRLLPAERPEVGEALATVSSDLLARCLNESEARDYLTAVLVGLGESGFAIRSDGPVSAERDRIDEAIAHVKQGCFEYSGIGWSESGQAVYYLAGQHSAP
jgi:hypothetical protein